MKLPKGRVSGSWLRHVRSRYLAQTRAFSGKSLAPRYTRNGVESKGENVRIDTLQTLAIETSCDDTSVAVLQISRQYPSTRLQTNVLFHETITSNSESYGGIHPLEALHSHQRELAMLVNRAVQCLSPFPQNPPSLNSRDGINASSTVLHDRPAPDFVSVTRGPGMRSNLSTGLDLAKGLAIAWGVPLIGVHHMQAHALTPRLCATLQSSEAPGKLLLEPSRFVDSADSPSPWLPSEISPNFPFLTVLASGGHSMLIDSASLTDHKTLAETTDIAIGDLLDKAARAILPPAELKFPYGRSLEHFAFSDSDRQSKYVPPSNRGEELERRVTSWGWSFGPPLGESKGGSKTSKRMMYSFAGLLSSVQRLVDDKKTMEIEERKEVAFEVQRVAFEHLGSRILLHLASLSAPDLAKLNTIVVSGGVASNTFLRRVLRGMLDIRGHQRICLEFPPVSLCTDNALMIAWAGMEMYDAGYESELSIQAIRKWSMDATASDGGIFGVGGWRKRAEINQHLASNL